MYWPRHTVNSHSKTFPGLWTKTTGVFAQTKYVSELHQKCYQNFIPGNPADNENDSTLRGAISPI